LGVRFSAIITTIDSDNIVIISRGGISPCDKDIKFKERFLVAMADSMITFAITAGIFAFLVAVVFGARAKRYSSGYTSSGGHAETSG
jgi:hypothetical protein